MKKIETSAVLLKAPTSRETLQAMITAVLAMLFRLHREGDQYTGMETEFPPIWQDVDGKRFPWWPMPAGFTQDYSGYGAAWLVENLVNRIQFAVFHTDRYNDAVDRGDLKEALARSALAGRHAFVIWNMANDLGRLAFLPAGAVVYSPLQVPSEMELA